MTDHPCQGMTEAQVAAFERLAINELPADGWKSIDALEAAGLIKRERHQARDAMGVYWVTKFHVPLAVHIKWSAWCSEQETGL